MSNNTQPTAEQRADQQAADIEKYAAFIRANPEIAEEIGTETRFLVYLLPDDDTKAKMADFVRAGLRAGAKVDKDVTDKYAYAYLRFGDVTVQVYAAREVVCERVVTGTREEVIEEPDPELLAAATASVPTVKRTEVVETVEWRCTPLLAATEDTTARDEQMAEV